MDTIPEVSEKYVRSVLKLRNPDSRKGENGSVAVIGGGRLYHGAPFLAASSALRTGVDLLYLCVPQNITTAVRALSPNIIVIPRPDVKITTGAANKILKWLPKIDSLVLGPGLGRQRTDGSIKLVRELSSEGVKVVLDADALRTDIVNEIKGRNAVITPHIGEFKRLYDIDLNISQDERVEAVRKMAAENKITILLKSKIDIISDGTNVILNKTGSPAMTAGGTGDILSGLVGGLLAKGLDAYDAAALGAFFNGLAGEKVTESKGFHLVASDLIDEIPSTMMKYE